MSIVQLHCDYQISDLSDQEQIVFGNMINIASEKSTNLWKHDLVYFTAAFTDHAYLQAEIYVKAFSMYMQKTKAQNPCSQMTRVFLHTNTRVIGKSSLRLDWYKI